MKTNSNNAGRLVCAFDVCCCWPVAALHCWNQGSVLKFSGIALAVAGACIVLFAPHGSSPASGGSGPGGRDSDELVGNLCFLLNVHGITLYVVMAKVLARAGYPPFTTTAWTSLLAALCILVAVPVVAGSPALYETICGGGCTPPGGSSDWSLFSSMDAALTLLYVVVVFSTLGFTSMFWGCQFVDAGKVAFYSTFQPFFAGVLSLILIAAGYAAAHPEANLRRPGLNALGSLVITAGMVLVLQDDFVRRVREGEGGAAAAGGGTGNTPNPLAQTLLLDGQGGAAAGGGSMGRGASASALEKAPYALTGTAGDEAAILTRTSQHSASL